MFVVDKSGWSMEPAQATPSTSRDTRTPRPNPPDVPAVAVEGDRANVSPCDIHRPEVVRRLGQHLNSARRIPLIKFTSATLKHEITEKNCDYETASINTS